MLSNLLSNAVQHGSEEPIHLTVRGAAASAVIEIHNQGEPIPAEAIATLFDPMVRLAREGHQRAHGSVGLGLYICREIARAHGGAIHVSSSAGFGTTFTVDLPKYSPVESTLAG